MRHSRFLPVCATALAMSGRMLHAQPAPDELLQRVRQKVSASVSHAPNYTCTETVNRFTYSGTGAAVCNGRELPDSDYTLHAKDRLRLDVGVSGSNEIFSWHGEKSFKEGNIAALVGYGAIGSGMFSSFLTAIFGDARGTFRFERASTQEGRPVSVFSYLVPREVSTWNIYAGDTKAIAGYQGKFVADSESADLLALSVEAVDITHAVAWSCGIRTSTQYHQVSFGGTTFLLPKQVKTVMLYHDGGKTATETEYADCRQFLAESSIHFEDPDSPAAKPVAAAVFADLPPDLTFRARVTSHIDFESSWVGDPVEGSLEAPLLGLNHEPLAPRGARITGRLVRLESVEQPSRRLEFAIDWQQIDSGKTLYRLAARRAGSADPEAVQLFDAARSVQETTPDQTFILKGAHMKLDSGFTGRWVTEKLRSPPHP